MGSNWGKVGQFFMGQDQNLSYAKNMLSFDVKERCFSIFAEKLDASRLGV